MMYPFDDQFLLSMLLILLVVVMAAMTYYKVEVGSTSIIPGTRLPVCLPSIPYIGSAPFLKTSFDQIHRYFMEQSTKLGNVFALYAGTRYAIVLNGSQAIREALVKNSTEFADRAPAFAMKAYINAKLKGIANSEYTADFKRRRQLYLSILKQFGFGQRLMETRIQVEVSELLKQTTMMDGRPFDPHLMLMKCVLNVTTSILVGRRYEFDDPSLDDFVHRMHTFIQSDIVRMELSICPLLRFSPTYRKRLRQFVAAHAHLKKFVMQQVKEVLDESTSNRREDSFVNQFMEAAEREPSGSTCFDHDELVFTLFSLFNAGGDTTATSLRWALITFANYPEVQRRVQLELDSVVPHSGPGSRLPSLDDQPNLPYFEAVLLEIMRYHTIVPIPFFHATLSDTQVDGCFIPAGTMVIVNLYSAHMDRERWTEPELFKPERFLDDDGKVTGKDGVVSFSLGKRACLGEILARQQLFLVLTALLQNFDIRPPEGHDKINYEEINTFICAPTPVDIRLIPRNHVTH